MMPSSDNDSLASREEGQQYADDLSCRVCSNTWEALFSFFCHFQYAVATDPEIQQAFQASFGLCPTHTWLLGQLASPRGRCDCYPPLLEDLAGRLQALAGHPEASRHIEAMMGSPDRCVACREKDCAESYSIGMVRQELAAAPDWPINLCLRHLSVILKDVDETAAAALVRHHARLMSDIAHAMRNYAAKYDARRRGDMSREERASPRDALELLAGAKNLFFIRKLE